MLGNKGVKPKITALTGTVIGATKESSISMDDVNMHHHDLHLELADRSVVAIGIA